MNDDAKLIQETLAGNSAAFGQLVQKYQDRLFNTVAHLLGNPEDARDVVQDALVQAFVKLETFRQSSAFYTWLYRIAFNMAATYRRRRRPLASLDAARETTGHQPADPRPGPREDCQRQERVQQVRRAMAALHDQYRAILVLREMEGCGYETIAEILDLPVGTVRSRLHRARMQLKEQLKEVLILEP